MALPIHPKTLTKIPIGIVQGSKAPTPSNSSKVSYNANLKHLPLLANEESQLKAARWGEYQQMARFLKLGQWIPNFKKSSTSNNYKIKFKEEYNQSISGVFKTSSRLSNAICGKYHGGEEWRSRSIVDSHKGLKVEKNGAYNGMLNQDSRAKTAESETCSRYEDN
ncbi:hypothetical protein Cgig2_023839 [Carnegiea gigantea]|uniref:Uncharacterized protein n=1 Tax=Carnegiea gigantea TaxID=171969 RepID=A0A9Q1K9E8_9CARY|nr:hypothetical protein Cgig2_023839 [Carnegiea gigantea]